MAFPTDIFKDLPTFETEEPEKTLGEKYREEHELPLGEEQLEERVPPRLKDWYRKALTERAELKKGAPGAYSPVLQALAFQEEKAKHDKTYYPDGGKMMYYATEKNKTLNIDDPPILVGYGSASIDYEIDIQKKESIGEWSWENPPTVAGVSINWKGEPLPKRAKGWRLDGETPFYGEGLMAPFLEFWDTVDKEREETLAQIEETGTYVRSTTASHATKWLPLVTLGGKLFEAIASKPLGRLVGTPSLAFEMMAEEGEPILWQIPGQKRAMNQAAMAAEFEAKHGYPPPVRPVKDHWIADFFERIDPLRNWSNYAITTYKLATGKLSFKEFKEPWGEAWEMSRMAWSLGWRDAGDRAEFKELVADGKNPALVALHLEQPWTQALGYALFDITNLLQFFTKPALAVSKLDDAAKVMQPADEVAEILAKSLGDEPVDIAFLTDELLEAYTTASNRVTAGVENLAKSFGPDIRLGASKRHIAYRSAKGFADNIKVNVKNADDIADIFLNMAKMGSANRAEQRAAYLFLSDAVIEPKLFASEPAIELSAILRNFLVDEDGAIDGVRFLNQLRKADDPIKFVMGKTGRIIDDMYPTVREIIDAQTAIKKGIKDYKVSTGVQNFLDSDGKLSWLDRATALPSGKGLFGLQHRLQKQISSRLFIGTNMGIPTRGYVFDNILMTTEAGPAIHLHSSDAWMDIAKNWWGVDHPGLTQGFSRTTEKSLNKWAARISDPENMGSLLDAVLNRGATANVSRNVMDDWTQFGGRAMQWLEIKNSQKIIGFEGDWAMRQLIPDTMPSIDELAKYIPEDITSGLNQLVINEFGDIDAAKLKLMGRLSKNQPVPTIELMKWIDEPTKRILHQYEVLGEVERIAKEADSLGDGLNQIDELLEGLLSRGDEVARQHPIPQANPLNSENDVGHFLEGVWKAADDVPVDGVVNLDPLDAQELSGKVQGNINTVDSITRGWQWVKDTIDATIDHTLDDINELRAVKAPLRELYYRMGNPKQPFNEFVDVARANGFAARDFGEQLLQVSDKEAISLIDEIWDFFKFEGSKPTNKYVAKDKMWKLVNEAKALGYTRGRRIAVEAFNGWLDEVISVIGPDTQLADDLLNSPMVKAVAINESLAIGMDNAVMVDGVMKPVGGLIRGYVGLEDNANAVRALTSYMNPHIGSFRHGNTAFDTDIIQIVHRATGEMYDSIDNIPPEVAFDALNQYRVEIGFELLDDAYTDIVGHLPNIRIPEEAVRPWNIVRKFNTRGGIIDATDRRYLTEFLIEEGKLNELDNILTGEQMLAKTQNEIDKELVDLADNVINGKLDEVAKVIVKPFDEIADTDVIRIYQGRPERFDPKYGYSQSWSRDPKFARDYAGEGGEIFTKEVTGAEWKAAVEETYAQGARAAVSDKAKLTGLEEGRFAPEFAVDATEEVPFANDIESIVPPWDGGTDVSFGQNVHNTRDVLEATFRATKNGMQDVWGEQSYADLSDDAVKALDDWFDEATKRMPEIKGTAYHYAQLQRDFKLHDYLDRFGADALVSLRFNFHFWPTRTMYKFAERIPYNLGILNKYLIYRDAMNKYHADRPEWLRQAWSTNEIFHRDDDNPIFISLENTLNVFNNLGADFTDPDRRATYWSAVMDTVNKAPGNIGIFAQYAVAIGLKLEGEDLAAAKWAGRMAPVTETIKGLTSIVGINEGRGVEIDPLINIFADQPGLLKGITGRALGPYEEKRIAVALSHLAEQYPDIPEELLEQARNHEGVFWDEATAQVRSKGAWGNIVSLFTGSTARMRSKDDLVVSQFWQDYIFMMSQYENMDARTYRTRREDLMNKYPFAETMLLGRKGSDERNTAYAFAVLSRMAPGQTDEISKAAGFEQDIINYFYENKGDMSGLSPKDQEKFNIFISEAGATVAIPNNVTRGEWSEASLRYSEMMDEGMELFDEHIWDKVDAGYNLKGTSINQQNDWYDYLEQHPDVQEVMSWQTEYILNDPVLSAYYGSIDRLRSWWKGDMYQKLEGEFGVEIWDIQTQYFIYKDTGQDAKAKAWKKKHPRLQKYWDRKNEYYMPQITQAMATYGEKLPEGEDMRLRKDFVPEVASVGELDIAEYLEAPDIKTYTKDEWLAQLGPLPMEMALMAWENIEMPEDIKEYLAEIASGYNLTYEELVISIGQAE